MSTPESTELPELLITKMIRHNSRTIKLSANDKSHEWYAMCNAYINKQLSYRWQTARCCFVKLLRYCRTFCQTRKVWLPDCENNSKICLFVLTWSTNVTDGQTDRRKNRQIPHDSIDRACVASRGKNASQHLPVYLQQFPCYSNHNIAKKIAIFTYPGLHFLFALGTPLWQSRKTLHIWKDNSVLAKPLAACTYLFSIVSELYDA